MSGTAQQTTVTLSDLRSSRQALRVERVLIARWRHLLRARIDLAVATAALPDPLGRHVDHALASDAVGDLPEHLDLVCAVLDGGPLAELNRLDTLRNLDRRLARYQATVDRALGGTTDAFIQTLALDPAASLLVLREVR